MKSFEAVAALVMLAASAPFAIPDVDWTGTKADRRHAGLLGAVHTVTSSGAMFSGSSGDWTEGPRSGQSVTTYAEDGTRVEIRWDTGSGPYSDAVMARLVYSRNKDGILVGMTGYTRKGKLSEADQYSFDQNGRAVELKMTGSAGLLHRSVLKYDGAGRVNETIEYDKNNKVLNRTEIRYEDGERNVEAVTYSQVGSIFSRTRIISQEKSLILEYFLYADDHSLEKKIESRWDENGRQHQRELDYSPDSALRETHVFEYQYDTVGNWIREKESVCTWRFWIFQSCDPVKVTYRTITYYPENK